MNKINPIVKAFTRAQDNSGHFAKDKLCINCKWFGRGLKNPICGNLKVTNVIFSPVTGKQLLIAITDCEMQRSLGGKEYCGPTATWFKPMNSKRMARALQPRGSGRRNKPEQQMEKI